MSVPLVVGILTFRTMTGPLGGEIFVKGKLPRRRGARQRPRQAETASRPSLAGPRDGSGFSDGGSANTSTARSSGRKAGAGPADGLGEQPERAPTLGGDGPGIPAAEHQKRKKPPKPMKEMPGTPWALTKIVNEEEQIVPVIGGLLRSKDDKVRLRMVELLMDTAYAENSGREDASESTDIEWSIPRPKMD